MDKKNIMDLKNWLKNHPCLSLSCLEKQANLPAKTLSHFVNGRRDLNENHIQKLLPVVKNYGFEKQESVSLHSVRNKLSRVTYLISVLEHDHPKVNEIVPEAIKKAKEAVNELAQREVYKINENE